MGPLTARLGARDWEDRLAGDPLAERESGRSGWSGLAADRTRQPICSASRLEGMLDFDRTTRRSNVGGARHLGGSKHLGETLSDSVRAGRRSGALASTR
jgi:hypothetical protein